MIFEGKNTTQGIFILGKERAKQKIKKQNEGFVSFSIKNNRLYGDKGGIKQKYKNKLKTLFFANKNNVLLVFMFCCFNCMFLPQIRMEVAFVV